MDVKEAVAIFLDDLALSPATVRTYRYGLQAFARYLCAAQGQEEGTSVPFTAIDEGTLSGFRRWLRKEYGRDVGAMRTSATYMAAARRFLGWADLEGLLPEGVLYDRMVRRARRQGVRRQGYEPRETDRRACQVIQYYLERPLPEKRGPRRLALLRNRALMAFLYDTAARIGEALALTRGDVRDGAAAKVRLTKTKNGKPRTVFLSESTRRLLSEYLSEREDGPNAPVFLSHGRNRGTAITSAHAWLLVKRAATAEGLIGTTSPHALRHRRAQDLLDDGMPLEWVSALLGHTRTDTTRTVYAWQTDETRLGELVTTYGRDPLAPG